MLFVLTLQEKRKNVASKCSIFVFRPPRPSRPTFNQYCKRLLGSRQGPTVADETRQVRRRYQRPSAARQWATLWPLRFSLGVVHFLVFPYEHVPVFIYTEEVLDSRVRGNERVRIRANASRSYLNGPIPAGSRCTFSPESSYCLWDKELRALDEAGIFELPVDTGLSVVYYISNAMWAGSLTAGHGRARKRSGDATGARQTQFHPTRVLSPVSSG